MTIYVSLPPPGAHRNDTRYPVAIVGGGYRGILESPSTRIPGSSRSPTSPRPPSRSPAVTSRASAGNPARRAISARSTGRCRASSRARDPAVAILSFAALAFAVIALGLGSVPLARAGLLAAPLALAFAIALSGAAVTRTALLLPLLAVLTVAVSAAAGILLGRRVLAGCFVALIAAYLVVLVAKPTWPALAAIGPNPGRGLALLRLDEPHDDRSSSTVALFAGAVFGLRGLLPIALLSLVTVGWSKAGADGGGLVVLAAACTALGLRLTAGRLTVRAVALAGAVAVAAGLAFVGLDAATGGHSHVTRRVREGPGALLDELGNRLHISAEVIASSWHAALVFAVAMVALVVLARSRPRFAAGDALLVGVAVSLLVNDTPQHVAAAGAISYGVLWVFERVRLAEPRRVVRLGADAPPVRNCRCCAFLAVGIVAGCGYEGQTTASPETVDRRSVPQPTETTPTETTPGHAGSDAAAGKVVFTTNCGGCHTLSDAGTSGTVGPNLDDAKPDAALVVDRVTKGKGVMPPFRER